VRLSAKGEYAITALLDLAMHDKEGLQPIQEIAARQGIPQRYLEQVLLQLKRAGLLESRRGSAGGYRLSRPADQVTVGTVLRAVEGSISGAGAVRRAGGHVPAESIGDLSDLWREISEAVSGVVDRLTLDDLRRRAEDRRSRASPMYHI
jgi:Rrf2 family transcriptional regulator, cysteine metabolism repressor